jgi:type IV/VI secretion system ImpK/VasF family protein
MAPRSPTLAEACAPVLLHLTAFRRNSATFGQSIQELQLALQRELERVKRACDEDAKLRPLYERVHYALVAAADQVVLSSAWPQKAGWSVQLLEMHYFQTAEGGKRFFRFVDEILSDPSEGAAEIAELLFHCMALGFQGELLGEPRELERRRRQLYEKARLPGRMGEKLTPEAYGRDVPRRMPRLPTLGILRLSLISVAAIVFGVLIGTFGRTIWQGHLRKIIDRSTESLESSRGDPCGGIDRG